MVRGRPPVTVRTRNARSRRPCYVGVSPSTVGRLLSAFSPPTTYHLRLLNFDLLGEDIARFGQLTFDLHQ